VCIIKITKKNKKIVLPHAIISANAKSIFEDRKQKDGSDETSGQSQLNAFFNRKTRSATRDSIGEAKFLHYATNINH
jgi:hypothetical protein